MSEHKDLDTALREFGAELRAVVEPPLVRFCELVIQFLDRHPRLEAAAAWRPWKGK